MSLKAKLEAVIYAAEEPVTLNQLAALFAADAMEWNAAREAAVAEHSAEVEGVAVTAVEPLPLIETGTEGTREQGTEEQQGTGIRELGAEEQGSGLKAAEAGPADPEAESKRLARQRDREVKAVLKQLLDELIAGCIADGRGVEIREIAGGYRMATKPECHDAVRLFVKSLKPPLKLSLPALETLAVIAYKQPVTAPEVSEIRGVESSGVLGSLLARKLIATAGRKQVIGRPILYKTTKEFLLRFGLKDVSELPSMEEFEKMAAIELEDAGPETGETAEDDGPVAETQEAPETAEPAPEQTVQENAAPNLESNSPSGEELAATAEAAGVSESEVTEIAPDPMADAAPPDVAPSAPGVSLGPAYPAVEPAHAEEAPSKPDSEQAEIEAFSHAEENQEEG